MSQPQVNPDELPLLRAALDMVSAQRNDALNAVAQHSATGAVLKGKLDEANMQIVKLQQQATDLQHQVDALYAEREAAEDVALPVGKE